jgi:hypothetical protein
MVACVCTTSFSPNAPDGSFVGCIVFTAKFPHASVAFGAGHVTVKSL